MPDRRYDRDPRLEYDPGHDFFVEGPEILHRPAAAAQDDDIDVVPCVEVADSGSDLLRGAGTLDLRRVYQDVQRRIAALQDPQHVADRGSGRGRNNTDLSREQGEGTLADGLEQPFAAQFLLELLKSQLEGAEPHRHHVIRQDLIIAARLIKTDAPPDQHLEAVFGLELQIAVGVPEARRLDLGLVVFEGEIHVA